MIWRWPDKIRAGHVADEIVETVDLANTLCALTGLEPMQTSDGQYVIVYNGEIFNFKELREDLEQKGFVFKSKSDTWLSC